MNVTLLVQDNRFWNGLADRLRGALPDAATDRLVLTEDRNAPELADTDALICYGLTPEELDRMPRLRYLAIPMAGLNTLPLDALREREITLVNAHANGRWVAERAMALILGWYGRLVPFHNDLAQKRWHGFAIGEPVTQSWESIVGTKVTLLGTGSIAQWTARLLAPYDVKIRGFRRTEGSNGLPPGLFPMVTTSLTESLEGSDTVVVTLPLTAETKGLIGAKELAAMRGALLVNVGRGPVIDEAALYAALSDGTLSGAAIDTWYTYPKDGDEGVRAPADTPIYTLPNVLLSPHLGGFTPQATMAGAREVVEDLVGWLSTGRATDAVDLTAEY